MQSGYVMNLLLAIDKLGNALIGGDHRETISARAGRLHHQPGWRQLANVLEWIDPGHCGLPRPGVKLQDPLESAYEER